MDKQTILFDWEQSTQKLLEALSHFTPENFNDRPNESTWSAAEIAEHLLKLDVVASKALQAESISTNRLPGEKIAFIKERMEDDIKREAPERVRPSSEAKDLPAITAQIRQQREEIKEAIQTLDETETCVGLQHPALGALTRVEWIYFVIYHAERHLKQLKQLEKSAIN